MRPPPVQNKVFSSHFNFNKFECPNPILKMTYDFAVSVTTRLFFSFLKNSNDLSQLIDCHWIKCTKLHNSCSKSVYVNIVRVNNTLSIKSIQRNKNNNNNNNVVKPKFRWPCRDVNVTKNWIAPNNTDLWTQRHLKRKSKFIDTRSCVSYIRSHILGYGLCRIDNGDDKWPLFLVNRNMRPLYHLYLRIITTRATHMRWQFLLFFFSSKN